MKLPIKASISWCGEELAYITKLVILGKFRSLETKFLVHFFFCFWKNFSKLRFLIFLICKRTLDSSCSFRHHFCCLILTQPFESINFPGFVVILTIRNSLFLFFFNCSSNETFSFWWSAFFLKLLYIRLTCTLAFFKIIQFIENIQRP